METAKSIREDFLHQNGFHEIDSFCSPEKIYKMMDIILLFHKESDTAIRGGVDIKNVIGLEVREDIARFRYVPENEVVEEENESELKILESFAKI